DCAERAIRGLPGLATAHFVECIGISVVIGAHSQAVKPRKGKRASACILERTKIVSTTERIDGAVSNIADDNRCAIRAEVRGCERDAPGRVERSARRDQALHKVAFEIVDVDEPRARAGDRQVRGILLGVSYKYLIADLLNVIGRVTCRQIRIGELMQPER